MSRSIAVLKPAACEERVAHAMQLLNSMLWAFRGSTETSWVATSPDEADVVVVHRQDDSTSGKQWAARGKVVVEIATSFALPADNNDVLVYPFRAEHVRALLERLDARLRASDARSAQSLQIKGFSSGHEWSFVEKLRAMRQREEKLAWLVALDHHVKRLFLRWNATGYLADAETVEAIRSGTLEFGRLSWVEGAPPVSGARWRSGQELLWFAAFHASEQLADSLEDAHTFRVLRWPNVAAIRPTPSQMRITAALAAGEAQISQVAIRARVAGEEVIRTVNALAAADLLATSRNDAREVAPMRLAAATSRRRGFTALLQGMRKHLGLGAST